MLHHKSPPTALGVRQTTLSHKIHAFLHSLRLEQHTWQQLQQFLQSTFAYTSDMGTEGSFNLASVDVPEYFPYWSDSSTNSHLSLEFGEDEGAAEHPIALGDVGDGGQMAPADCRTADLSGSLYIPGMFHIIDNATKDMLKKSFVWNNQVKAMLEAVLLFFNGFHRRRWFVARCCVGAFATWSIFFESAPPKLEGGRAWGVVSEGIAWVLRRKVMLQQAWSAAALLAGGPAAGREGDAGQGDQAQQESTKLVTRVDEAMQSSLFWTFLGVGSCITDILDSVTSWTQGCACHGHEIRTLLKPLLQGKGPLSCPMRGRRAPEVGEGALHRYIDGLFQFNDSQILLVHTANLDREEKTQVTLDWSAMKILLRMHFDLKLSPWRQLPLSTLGLGHPDRAIAQRLLWNCLVDFERLSDEQRAAAHPHSKKLFQEHRQEIDAFVRGDVVASWQGLAIMRAQSVFVPILEQSIERRHAILHQHLKTAPHHSAAFVSLCERKEEILALLSTETAGSAGIAPLQRLADLCSLTRTAPLVAQALGLVRHAEFAPYLCAESEQLDIGTPHCLVASVVCRCDLSTQYKSLSPVHKRPYNPRNLPVFGNPSIMDRADDGAAVWGDDEGGDDGGPGRVEQASDEQLQRMLGFHAWAHLVSAAGPQDFFSITPSQALPVKADSLMLPLEDVVVPGQRQANRQFPLSLCNGPRGVTVEMDFADDDGVPQSCSDLAVMHLPGQDSHAPGAPPAGMSRPVMFRVVSGTVGQKKLARTDEGLQLTGEHIAVERCAFHELDYQKREVSVITSDGASQAELFQRPASFQTCLHWRVQCTKAGLRGSLISPEAECVLEKILQAQGSGMLDPFELSMHSEDYDSTLAGLRALEGQGFVESLARADSGGQGLTSWRLSAKAVESLCQVVVLHNAAPLLRLPADLSNEKFLKQPDKMTVLELVMRLRAEGFVFEVRSTDLRAEPPPFNVSTQRPKKWYARDRSLDVCQSYLLALLSPDVMRKHGHLEVRRLQKAAYYHELFGQACRRKGARKKAGHVQMLDDAGVDAMDLVALEDAVAMPKAKPKAKRAPQPIRDTAEADADASLPPEVSRAPAGRAARSIHPKTFRWGACLFTCKPSKSGAAAYQVTCPRICAHRHTGGQKTSCTKTKSFDPADSSAESLTIRQLKFWVLQARDFASRAEHMQNCDFLDPPGNEDLEARKIPSDYETEDEELRPLVKRRRMRGKQQDDAATSAPKAKCKAKAKVWNSVASSSVPEPREPESGCATSSSSSDSDSSSSSSATKSSSNNSSSSSCSSARSG